MALVFTFILGCIIYKILLSTHLSILPVDIKYWRQAARMGSAVTSTFINLLLILLMGNIYQTLAYRLTKWGKSS